MNFHRIAVIIYKSIVGPRGLILLFVRTISLMDAENCKCEKTFSKVDGYKKKLICFSCGTFFKYISVVIVIHFTNSQVLILFIS